MAVVKKQSRFVSNILYFVGKYILKLFFHIEVEKPFEKLDFREPLLILVKHQSNFDVMIGYAVLRQILHRYPWAITKKMFAHPVFLGLFLKTGSIPVDRKNPRNSKNDLLAARKILYAGNAIVIFPEQSRVPGKMGEGKVGGFRFIAGKPETPLAVLTVGMRYERDIIRKKVVIRFGSLSYYSKEDNADVFMYQRMKEIAELSGMDYPFLAPVEPRKEV